MTCRLPSRAIATDAKCYGGQTMLEKTATNLPLIMAGPDTIVGLGHVRMQHDFIPESDRDRQRSGAVLQAGFMRA